MTYPIIPHWEKPSRWRWPTHDLPHHSSLREAFTVKMAYLWPTSSFLIERSLHCEDDLPHHSSLREAFTVKIAYPWPIHPPLWQIHWLNVTCPFSLWEMHLLESDLSIMPHPSEGCSDWGCPVHNAPSLLERSTDWRWPVYNTPSLSEGCIDWRWPIHNAPSLSEGCIDWRWPIHNAPSLWGMHWLKVTYP